MSHDIEADYKEDYGDEDRCCPKCKSHNNGHCNELGTKVSPTGYCDFFSSLD